VQDPDTYLNELNVSFGGWMNASAPAMLDADHRSLLNREAFYFADLEAKQTFDADPVHHCGLLTDPVSGERFQPRDDSPRFDYNGRPFYFVSDATLDAFTAMPDSFFLPTLRMMPKEGMKPAGGMEGDGETGTKTG
jgi:YHS domain-containing protein